VASYAGKSSQRLGNFVHALCVLRVSVVVWRWQLPWGAGRGLIFTGLEEDEDGKLA
jgi:hypothetical protein